MLMLGDKAGLTVDVPVHPNGVGWGRGWGSVQVCQFLLHRTSKKSFLHGTLPIHGRGSEVWKENCT